MRVGRRIAIGIGRFAQPSGVLLDVEMHGHIKIVVKTLGAVGIYATLAIFWTSPSELLQGAAAASGFALINAVRNLGGYLGPSLVNGIFQRRTWDLQSGSRNTALSLALTGLQALRL